MTTDVYSKFPGIDTAHDITLNREQQLRDSVRAAFDEAAKAALARHALAVKQAEADHLAAVRQLAETLRVDLEPLARTHAAIEGGIDAAGWAARDATLSRVALGQAPDPDGWAEAMRALDALSPAIGDLAVRTS